MIFLAPQLDSEGQEVLQQIDELKARLGAFVREPMRWTGPLRRNIFAKAIQGSNTIEGYNITVDDAIAAVEGEEPLQADQATWLEIMGYRQAMTYVRQLAKDPQFKHSADKIKGLHFMLLSHDMSKGPGLWRPGYVAVKEESTGQVVYEGPDAGMVPDLVAKLVDQLNDERDGHAIVRGAMAHLNLTMIHPFRDGNGRMARCLQTLVLGCDGILSPEFSSIEEYLGRNTQAYYDVLAEVGQGQWHPERSAAPWLRFCLTAHFRQAQTVLNRIERTKRIWDALEQLIHERGLPDRTIFALADAAQGHRVRNPIYRRSAEISTNLASRDLRALVSEKLLLPEGEKKGRFYVAAPTIREIRKTHDIAKRQIKDPFGQLKSKR